MIQWPTLPSLPIPWVNNHTAMCAQRNIAYCVLCLLYMRITTSMISWTLSVRHRPKVPKKSLPHHNTCSFGKRKQPQTTHTHKKTAHKFACEWCAVELMHTPLVQTTLAPHTYPITYVRVLFNHDSLYEYSTCDAQSAHTHKYTHTHTHICVYTNDTTSVDVSAI